jgi:sRNA-binding regulator protein Hfq
MSIRDPLAPPKEFLRELARDDRPQDGRRREGRGTQTSPGRRQAYSPGAPVAAAATAPPKSVQALLNMPITLHLRNGTQLSGVLAQVWQYEFVVRTCDGSFRIILKHAVDMIESARPETVSAGDSS